jgi:hypothetical protein
MLLNFKLEKSEKMVNDSFGEGVVSVQQHMGSPKGYEMKLMRPLFIGECN